MVNAISAGCGSSVGEKSPPIRSITYLTRRLQTDSRKFLEKNLGARWFSSNRTAKLSLPRKPSIAHCDIDLREDGWHGATITFRDSRPFPKSLTRSSLVIAGSAPLLLACSGEKTCGRQRTSGLDAGFFARLDSLI